MACVNDIQPLQLPIRNVTFGAGGSGSTRGIELGVGTPQQIISALPGVHDQDLPVWSMQSCDRYNGTEAQCVAVSGGVYDPTQSDTYDQVRLSEWNGTTDTGRFSGDWLFFNDRLSFGVGGDIHNMPFIMTTERRSDQCVLPLAPNSTFLRAAYDSGQIPSTALGIYAGSISVEAPDEGLVVVGGLDTTGYIGELTEMRYDPLCPACLDIDSITYKTANGTTEILDKAMRAVFWFGAEDITLPLPAFHRLSEATQLVPESGRSGSADEALLTFEGNLTVILTNGFEMIIPSYELFHQRRNYSETGRFSIKEDLPSRVFIDSLNGTSETIYEWGMPFLSQVYLAYDYDRHTAKIGKARRLDRRQTIEAGDFSGRHIETICPPASSVSEQKSSTGAIVGGVVGGLVLLIALIALGLWLCLRHHRSRGIVRAHVMGSNDRDTLFVKPSGMSIDAAETGSPAYSPSTAKAIDYLHEKHVEMAYSPSTTKSRAELPEEPLLELSSQARWRWPDPVELDAGKTGTRPENPYQGVSVEGLHELHMPTPTRRRFSFST